MVIFRQWVNHTALTVSIVQCMSASDSFLIAFASPCWQAPHASNKNPTLTHSPGPSHMSSSKLVLGPRKHSSTCRISIVLVKMTSMIWPSEIWSKGRTTKSGTSSFHQQPDHIPRMDKTSGRPRRSPFGCRLAVFASHCPYLSVCKLSMSSFCSLVCVCDHGALADHKPMVYIFPLQIQHAQTHSYAYT